MPSDIYSLGVVFWELSSGDRETPIAVTPIGFKGHYPEIEGICKKLDHMRLEPIYKDMFEKNAFGKKFEYSSFENKTEISKEKIGEGGYGIIHKVYLEDIKKIVALKTLEHDDEEAFIREVKCTTKANHDNIIKFLELYKIGLLGLEWQKKFLAGLTVCMGQIFFIGIFMIKTLVHEGRMIITDFDLSKSLDDETESISSGVYGRCEYCDPNHLPEPLKYKWNKHSDIYSIGVLFWELSSGAPPFKDFKNKPTKISCRLLKGQREHPIEGTPIDFQNLYYAAWNGNPDNRPNINEICNKLGQIRLELVYEKVLYYFFY
ncbi:kinase-like domain-containing protein [Gigaspora rosea]|uniref:Kinase-like domain-containing protein n=1 Tax=Gigaspora rosea TaxID=44941 RepID=A0A397VPJ6_9GLOM|nr:kinase-like domain-containing protein [Gigaspora rosea]